MRLMKVVFNIDLITLFGSFKKGDTTILEERQATEWIANGWVSPVQKAVKTVRTRSTK